MQRPGPSSAKLEVPTSDESALYRNFCILGLHLALRQEGFELSPTCFRRSNNKALEHVLYRLFTLIEGKQRASKDFKDKWPVLDKVQQTPFYQRIGDWTKELKDAGRLDPSVILPVSALKTNTSNRHVDWAPHELGLAQPFPYVHQLTSLLLELSTLALQQELEASCPDQAQELLPLELRLGHAVTRSRKAAAAFLGACAAGSAACEALEAGAAGFKRSYYALQASIRQHEAAKSAQLRQLAGMLSGLDGHLTDHTELAKALMTGTQGQERAPKQQPLQGLQEAVPRRQLGDHSTAAAPSTGIGAGSGAQQQQQIVLAVQLFASMLGSLAPHPPSQPSSHAAHVAHQLQVHTAASRQMAAQAAALRQQAAAYEPTLEALRARCPHQPSAPPPRSRPPASAFEYLDDDDDSILHTGTGGAAFASGLASPSQGLALAGFEDIAADQGLELGLGLDGGTLMLGLPPRLLTAARGRTAASLSEAGAGAGFGAGVGAGAVGGQGAAASPVGRAKSHSAGGLEGFGGGAGVGAPGLHSPRLSQQQLHQHPVASPSTSALSGEVAALQARLQKLTGGSGSGVGASPGSAHQPRAGAVSQSPTTFEAMAAAVAAFRASSGMAAPPAPAAAAGSAGTTAMSPSGASVRHSPSAPAPPAPAGAQMDGGGSARLALASLLTADSFDDDDVLMADVDVGSTAAAPPATSFFSPVKTTAPTAGVAGGGSKGLEFRGDDAAVTSPMAAANGLAKHSLGLLLSPRSRGIDQRTLTHSRQFLDNNFDMLSTRLPSQCPDHNPHRATISSR
eukprot:XP_001699631.1 predicted protein [Chlamydomonas reinhardtii]